MPIALLVLLFALGMGCRVDPGVEHGALDAVAEVSAVIPTVVSVSWTSDAPGEGFVEYGLDGALDRATPGDAGGTGHAVALLGLKAGRSYSWRAVTVTAGGERLESAVGTVELDPPPAELPRFTLTTAASDRGGFVLTSFMGEDAAWTIIIDADADPVWFRAADDGLNIPTTRFSAETASVLIEQNDREQVSDLGGLLRVALDGSEVLVTRTQLGHHDALRLADGTVAWLAVDVRDVEVDGEVVSVAGDALLETPEGSGDDVEPTVIWSTFDAFDEVIPPCEHFFAEAYHTGAYDWTHANSILYDAEADDYLVLLKNFDALFRIDRGTGETVWQLGGTGTDFTFDDRLDGWSHGHMSHFWGDGMAVFDNGYHHEPRASRAMVYDIDEGAREVHVRWSYDDPEERFIPLLGDVRWLGDGALTSWTAAGLLVEVDEDGEVVWQAEADLGAAVGRATWVADLTDLSGVGAF